MSFPGMFASASEKSLFPQAAAETCMKSACSDDADCNKGANQEIVNLQVLARMTAKAQQSKACECVSASLAAERRKDELTRFYEQHAPEQVSPRHPMLLQSPMRLPVPNVHTLT